MKCPFCGHLESKVTDSRAATEGDVIRRRRECEKCERRFTTYERVEAVLPLVVKKDGRRESFERSKVLGGIRRACEKRKVPLETIEREHIRKTLEDVFWRVEGPSGAAAALGMNASTLRARMRKLGLRRPEARPRSTR